MLREWEEGGNEVFFWCALRKRRTPLSVCACIILSLNVHVWGVKLGLEGVMKDRQEDGKKEGKKEG